MKFIQCPFINVPKQTDSYNCGVYIGYYAFTIMKESNFDKKFNPDDFRDAKKRYLLENSEDIDRGMFVS
ncbi:Hypothetical protein CINCED_3A025837 [Cinara cedri]|uniref:Ulp1 protease family, C-terminal catalytic domain n=1 Tax=Cinara cedri TaxID=506608 RepID=A0A5E4NQM3_9HEMI|nr:Hypothetical protein CINCED_3A025837 [Cinara cedri]